MSADVSHPTVPRNGDLIVTPVHGGFLIGQIKPESGPGPWWDLVGATASFGDALETVRRRAAVHRSHAWLQLGADDYRSIDLEAVGVRVPARLHHA